jgi:hypothetical protein
LLQLTEHSNDVPIFALTLLGHITLVTAALGLESCALMPFSIVVVSTVGEEAVVLVVDVLVLVLDELPPHPANSTQAATKQTAMLAARIPGRLRITGPRAGVLAHGCADRHPTHRPDRMKPRAARAIAAPRQSRAQLGSGLRGSSTLVAATPPSQSVVDVRWC